MSAITGPVVPEAWRGGLPITYRIGPGPAKVHLKVFSNWQMQAALRRHRENSRLAISRRVGASRQSSRRLGERRGRSHLRPGSGFGGGAFARRARESRLEAQAHHHLLRLGWRRAWLAGFRRMAGNARGRTSPARRGLHQLRHERTRLLRRRRRAHAGKAGERRGPRRPRPRNEAIRVEALATSQHHPS